MIGLALQGGGTRGSYQIGAFYALKEAHIKFDGICGTSIGAFNGAMLASGKEKELMHFWENIDVGKILGYDEDYLEKRKSKEHDLSYYRLGIKNFWHILKSRGIKMEGLENVLKENLDIEALINSKIDYGMCTVRLHDLKPLYIFKKDMKKEKLYDYILASCYLPVFKMEKKVDDHYYLDGGFYDNTPINMLIDKGYTKIYVIELNPLININRKIKKEVEIIKITPKRSLGGVLNTNQESIKENIKMGYYDALRIIKKLDGYHYCFKNYPKIVYKFLMRKVNPKQLKRVCGFFNVKTPKEAAIKALEYVMKNEKIDYYQIYNPFKMIKRVKKEMKKEHFLYEFLRQMKFL